MPSNVCNYVFVNYVTKRLETRLTRAEIVVNNRIALERYKFI